MRYLIIFFIVLQYFKVMQDEQIICIALLKVKILDALNPQDIRVLAQFFNITEKGMFQQTMMELKKSIAYIILIQRYDLEEYLTLSKFKRLPNHLHQLLLLYFRTVRDCFENEKRSIQEENLRNLQKTSTGMEKISSLMQNALHKPPPVQDKHENGFNRYNFFNQYPQNMPQSRLNYSVPSISSMPSYLFPYQNYVGNHMFPQYSNRSNIVSNIMLDRSKEQQRVLQHPKRVQIPPRADPQNFKQEYLSDSNLQSQEAQSSKVSKYQCFCGQKRQDDIVKCRKCLKEYHLKCWTPLSAEDSVCPFCKLNYKHFYTKLAGEMILERCEQASQKLSNVKQIRLTSEQLQKLNNAIILAQVSQLYWLELRMLRVQISSQSQSRESRGVKSNFNIPISEARKLYNRKWLEIKLTNIGEGGYFLVTLVCTTPKQYQQLQNEVVNQKDESQNASGNNRIYSSAEIQSLKNNFTHPVTNRPITIPVRGIRCQHVQCEDLRYIYEMGSKRQPRIVCSFCHKQYSVYEGFQFDRLFMQKLKQIAQNNHSQVNLANSNEYKSSSKEKPQNIVVNHMVDERQEQESRNLRESAFEKAVFKQSNEEIERRFQ